MYQYCLAYSPKKPETVLAQAWFEELPDKSAIVQCRILGNNLSFCVSVSPT